MMESHGNNSADRNWFISRCSIPNVSSSSVTVSYSINFITKTYQDALMEIWRGWRTGKWTSTGRTTLVSCLSAKLKCDRSNCRDLSCDPDIPVKERLDNYCLKTVVLDCKRKSWLWSNCLKDLIITVKYLKTVVLEISTWHQETSKDSKEQMQC